jgi:signal transduction histidine kinase
VRIERNIHDGAQQRLVAIAVQLQLAQQLTQQGTPLSPDDLGALHAETRDAVDELRELARGVYPSVLTERGLVEALRSIGERSAIPVTVIADPVVELPREDAAGLYFVCLEALQNAAKHAPDASARLEVQRIEDEVVTTITDDGAGFDPDAVSNSRGMLNMADRAGALGGALSIDSAPGEGTRVTVRLPAVTTANVSA